MIRHVDSPNSYDHLSIRVLNVIAAVLILVIIGPLLMLVGLAIRLESVGPSLEPHLSTTRDGRQFRQLTFRVFEYDETWPRNMTRLGWFLLYTRIDRLPQLLNVLRGEMTLADILDNSSPY